MSSACPRWDDRQRLPRCPLCCRGGQPGPATHLQFVQAAVKMENAPDLSLRGPNGAVAISGRHLQPVQAAVKTVCAEVWGVAAVTAQPLAALPPYGCGVPLAGSERHADWHFLRYAFCGARPPDLSLRGGRRPTWRPERAARGSALGVQSREGTHDFADDFPVIQLGGARFPRRFAPRNDKSGSLSNFCDFLQNTQIDT